MMVLVLSMFVSRVGGLIPVSNLYAWILHVLLLVLRFPPLSKVMHYRLLVDISKWSVVGEYECVFTGLAPVQCANILVP